MWSRNVIGASVQGTSHVRAGTPCQDAHGYRVLEECVIAAVADGLGSAARSDEGAKLAVDTALDVLDNALGVALPDDVEGWIHILRSAFTEARRNLEQTAESNDLPLRDYGTTLITVVVTEDWLTVGQIGDGAAVALFADDTLETISKPQRGEYANETIPLTASDALTLAHFSARQAEVKALALLTDGLQNLSIDSETSVPYAPFFTPFFEGIGQQIDADETSDRLTDFLNSERVCAKTDDDKTLVVIGGVMQIKEPTRSEIETETLQG